MNIATIEPSVVLRGILAGKPCVSIDLATPGEGPSLTIPEAVAHIEAVAATSSTSLLRFRASSSSPSTADPLEQGRDLEMLLDILSGDFFELALETQASRASRIFSRFDHLSIMLGKEDPTEQSLRAAREIVLLVDERTDIDRELRRIRLFPYLKSIILEPVEARGDHPSTARALRYIKGSNRHLRPLLRISLRDPGESFARAYRMLGSNSYRAAGRS